MTGLVERHLLGKDSEGMVPWPRLRLRHLVESKPELSAHYQRLLHTAFESSTSMGHLLDLPATILELGHKDEKIIGHLNCSINAARGSARAARKR